MSTRAGFSGRAGYWLQPGRWRGFLLKDLFNDVRPVKKADDAHFARALGAREWVCFIDLSNKVGPALLYTGEFLAEVLAGDLREKEKVTFRLPPETKKLQPFAEDRKE
jgi:hypothetical protein